jgi:hypothetical protein
MRWYQSHLAMLVAGYAPTAGNVVIDFIYPVVMRAAPTVTFSSIVYSNMSGLSAAIALIDHCASACGDHSRPGLRYCDGKRGIQRGDVTMADYQLTTLGDTVLRSIDRGLPRW